MFFLEIIGDVKFRDIFWWLWLFTILIVFKTDLSEGLGTVRLGMKECLGTFPVFDVIELLWLFYLNIISDQAKGRVAEKIYNFQTCNRLWLSYWLFGKLWIKSWSIPPLDATEAFFVHGLIECNPLRYAIRFISARIKFSRALSEHSPSSSFFFHSPNLYSIQRYQVLVLGGVALNDGTHRQVVRLCHIVWNDIVDVLVGLICCCWMVHQKQ